MDQHERRIQKLEAELREIRQTIGRIPARIAPVASSAPVPFMVKLANPLCRGQDSEAAKPQRWDADAEEYVDDENRDPVKVSGLHLFGYYFEGEIIEVKKGDSGEYRPTHGGCYACQAVAPSTIAKGGEGLVNPTQGRPQILATARLGQIEANDKVQLAFDDVEAKWFVPSAECQ